MVLETASSTRHDDKNHTHLWDSFNGVNRAKFSIELNGAHYEFDWNFILNKINTATDAIERILGCFPFKNCGKHSIILTSHPTNGCGFSSS